MARMAASPGSAAWAFKKTHEGWEPTSTTPLEDADIELLTKIIEELEEMRRSPRPAKLSMLLMSLNIAVCLLIVLRMGVSTSDASVDIPATLAMAPSVAPATPPTVPDI